MRKYMHLIVRYITIGFGQLMAMAALLSLMSASSLGAGITSQLRWAIQLIKSLKRQLSVTSMATATSTLRLPIQLAMT